MRQSCDCKRAAGTAELTGYNLTLSHGRCAMLFHIVRDLFPKGGDLTEVKFWTGLRPMIPDGGPLIGIKDDAPYCEGMR